MLVILGLIRRVTILPANHHSRVYNVTPELSGDHDASFSQHRPEAMVRN